MESGDRRARVAAALLEAGGRGVSGETLAAELGVSRTAVAKHVAVLRASGFAVEALPGAGYRLLSTPDLPLPELVLPRLASAFFSRLEGGAVTGSTNDDCRALARAGAPEGTAVLAAEQTAGRGRLGRSWESPAGGLYVSALLRPRLAPADVPPLALAVAVGVARGLDDLTAGTTLKWPNDVLAPDGGKLAGVLLEMSAEADSVHWVVAGVGVNVRRPSGPAPGAAYLGAEGSGPPLAEVAARVLDGIAGAYLRFREDGFTAMREEYERRAWLTGREVTVRDAAGGTVASGKVAGVDSSGRLMLDTPGGPERVVAGEVTLR